MVPHAKTGRNACGIVVEEEDAGAVRADVAVEPYLITIILNLISFRDCSIPVVLMFTVAIYGSDLTTVLLQVPDCFFAYLIKLL